jgi:hypothetical protein
MAKVTISIFVMVLSASLLIISFNSHKAPVQSTDTLTIFVTGYELGDLKPCGCSGGQLGGLDRRSAIFNTAPKQARLIIDTGSLVKSSSEQDLIKFRIIVEAFSLLDYNLVNLSEEDFQIAHNLGLLDNPIVGFISPYDSGEKIAGRFQSQYSLNGKNITVSVLTIDLETSPIEQIRAFFSPQPAQQGFNILIVNRCDSAIRSSIAEVGTVDCLICPAESDEPIIISDPSERPLVFSVGRFGRYVAELKIYPSDENCTGSKEVLYSLKNGISLAFSAIPVTEDLPQQQALIDLYKSYQQLLKESDLLERYPRFNLPPGLEYVGSESCKYCHFFEYEICSDYAHAHAYATLEKVGSQFDPECIICHVIGFEYEGGFYSEQATPHFKNVGCENCHGPGSRHVVTYGLEKTVGPKYDCIDCHTPDHSTEYAGNEKEYMEKINHWVELSDPCDVKSNGD